MIGMADQKPHGRVGPHLRHRGRQRHRHGRARIKRWIPRMEGHDPLAEEHRDGHEPAPRRAHVAAMPFPRRVNEHQHRAHRDRHERHEHRRGKHPGARPTARRAAGGDPGRQRRRDPERDDHERMGGGEEGEDGRGATEDANRGGRIEKPLRRHEHDREHDERRERQQHGRNAIHMKERAAAEPVTQFAGHAVADRPPPGDQVAGDERDRQRRRRWKPRREPREARLQRGRGHERRADHRGHEPRDHDLRIGRRHRRLPVEPPRFSPNQAAHARSPSASRSSMPSTGATTSRVTAISS